MTRTCSTPERRVKPERYSNVALMMATLLSLSSCAQSGADEVGSVEQASTFVLRPRDGVIDRIEVSNNKPCLGEPVDITVIPVDAAAEVTISATPGQSRTMQFFGAPGEHVFHIQARSGDKISSEIVSVYAEECGVRFPRILTSPSVDVAREVNVFLDEDDGFKGPFQWEFSDGHTERTDFPAITHRFDVDDIDYTSDSTTFRVSVKDEESGATAHRTFALRPMYHYSREHGVIQPPLDFDVLNVSAGVRIHNVEDKELKLNTLRVRRWTCFPHRGEDPKDFPFEHTIPARSHFDHDFDPKRDLGPEWASDWDDGNVCGIEVHYMGEGVDGIPVNVPAYFEINEAPWRVERVTDPGTQEMLEQIEKAGLWEGDGDLPISEVQRLAREGHVEWQWETVTEDATDGGLIALDDYFRCTPGDEPPAEADGLECLPTGDFEYSRPYVGNAVAGDITLSAACGFVGQLLRQVDPAQYYSHTGMFTRHQDVIRHSTAAEDRYGNHRDGAVGAQGFTERYLRYGTPGEIDQSISQAYYGQRWQDDEGDVYHLSSFSDGSVECDGDAEVTEPMLVRVRGGADRVQLADVLRELSQLEAHYRFFAYSEGDIGNDASYNWTADPASEDGRSVATMCSSFLWTAANRAGVALEEGNTDSPPSNGVDGLYYYTAEERVAAAEHIQCAVFEQVRDESAWYETALSPAAAWRYSRQMVNCFAGDDCGDSARHHNDWQDTEGTNTVSPDDLLQWEGLWGEHEPMIMREGRARRIYAWQDASNPGFGNAEVHVIYNDEPVGQGVRVVVGDDFEVTDADGIARLSNLPAGTTDFRVMMSLDDGRFREGTALATIRDGETTVVVVDLDGTIDVGDYSPFFRTVTVRASGRLANDENFSETIYTDFDLFEELRMTPSESYQVARLAFCDDDEMRIEIDVHVAMNEPDGTIDIATDTRLYEGRSCDTTDLDGRQSIQSVVPRNESGTVEFRVINTGDRSGGDIAEFELTYQNDDTP